MAESFFLNPDEAKSMGNMDYMRTARKVKKSFPSSKAWGAGFEEEVEVSATDKLNGRAQTAPVESFKISEESKLEVSERRRAASDLDLFRNMAKDIRKV